MIPTVLGVLSAALLLKRAAALADDRQTAKAFVFIFAALWICNKLVALDLELMQAIQNALR